MPDEIRVPHISDLETTHPVPHPLERDRRSPITTKPQS
jgi:hypothetical protein